MSFPAFALPGDLGSVRPRGAGARVKGHAVRLVAGALALGVLATAAAQAEGPADALSLTRLGESGPAVPFRVATPDGGTIAIGELRGKVVLLNFWATWCEPCLEEMPAMERISRTYRDRGLVVLALSVDREGAPVVRTFLARHGLTFPVGLDPQQTVARLFRVWALPSTIILSRAGAPLYSAQGAREWDGPQGHALIDALLQQDS